MDLLYSNTKLQLPKPAQSNYFTTNNTTLCLKKRPTVSCT